MSDTIRVPYRGLITASAMLAMFMQTLNSTIANVALPYMQGSMSASADEITWVLTSYVIAAAIMTAPVGWMAVRFGRKRLFIICIAGFTIASMMCGAAQSLQQLVGFRLLQGMFGAALAPLSQATMLDIYPFSRRAQAMAIFSMGVTMGPMVGPTLGGYLTDLYSWRWVFYVNLPFGILSAVGLALFMPNAPARPHLKFSWYGFAMLALGAGALQMLLDRGQELDWFSSREIIVEAVLAGLGFYLFIVHMFMADKPFLSPGLFRDRNFSAGMVMVFFVSSVMLATSALLAPYLQNLAGYPVYTAGLGDGAARPGHHGLDVSCQPDGHEGGPAQDHGGGTGDPRLGAVGDEHLDARHHRARDVVRDDRAGVLGRAGVQPDDGNGLHDPVEPSCAARGPRCSRWRATSARRSAYPLPRSR